MFDKRGGRSNLTATDLSTSKFLLEFTTLIIITLLTLNSVSRLNRLKQVDQIGLNWKNNRIMYLNLADSELEAFRTETASVGADQPDQPAAAARQFSQSGV